MLLRCHAQGRRVTARKMNVRVEEISHCGECPFSYHDETDGTDEWRCTSDENEDHDGYRRIERVPLRDVVRRLAGPLLASQGPDTTPPRVNLTGDEPKPVGDGELDELLAFSSVVVDADAPPARGAGICTPA